MNKYIAVIHSLQAKIEKESRTIFVGIEQGSAQDQKNQQHIKHI